MALKERYDEIRAEVQTFAEELADGRELSDDRLTEHRSLMAEGEGLRERIELHEQAIGLLADGGGEIRGEVRPAAKHETSTVHVDRRMSSSRSKDFDRAVTAWFAKECRSDADRAACERHGIDYQSKALEFRLGEENLYERVGSSRVERRSNVEYRDQSIANDTQVIPPEFLNRLEIALQTFGNVRGVATVERTVTGADMPMPTVDDTGNVAAIIAEAVAYGAVTDVDFGSVTFKSFTYRDRLKASQEWLQDSSPVKIAGRLGDMLGQRIATKQNLDFTTGGGTTEPEGIITGATAVNTATTLVLAANDIIDLFHAVDVAYRGNAMFMCHDLVVAHIKKIRDDAGGAGLGNFLWGDLRDGADLRLQGRPVVINNHMDSDTTSQGDDVLLFGDMKKYYVRDVQAVKLQRADELYIENNQVGFFATARADGRVVDAGTNPLKYLNIV
jgi:HK97 family phage major capsid protein